MISFDSVPQATMTIPQIGRSKVSNLYYVLIVLVQDGQIPAPAKKSMIEKPVTPVTQPKAEPVKAGEPKAKKKVFGKEVND
jgi:hypothetical protein